MATLGRLQGQRTRTKLANALANWAAYFVQRAEQLMSLGEPPGFANEYISEFFHKANSLDVYRTFTHSQPQETKRKPTGNEKKAHERRTELYRNRT